MSFNGFPFSFIVMSDNHMTANDKDEKNINNKNLKNAIVENQKTNPVNWIVSCGDLMDRAKDHEDEKFNDLWWPDFEAYKHRHGGTPLLLEGLGNHDTEFQNGSKADYYKKFLLKHNEERENQIRRREDGFPTEFFKDYTKDSGKLHYYWRYTVDEGKFHFFMLNKFPGKGHGEPLWNENVRRRTDPDNSLPFLIDTLKKIPHDEPVFLFHHYGFRFQNVDNTLDDHWTAKQREEYVKAIADHKVVCIFYGHWHTLFYEKYNFTLCSIENGVGISRTVPLNTICAGLAASGIAVHCTVSKSGKSEFKYMMDIIQWNADANGKSTHDIREFVNGVHTQNPVGRIYF